MLPTKGSTSRPSHGSRSTSTPALIKRLLLLLVLLVVVLWGTFFVYSKCDTRAPMADMLTRTSRVLQAHEIKYWLDKGTLLGIYREEGLIPWEYDIDLGVMNTTCDAISQLKHEFTAQGLIAYDRQDDIPHKSKITYDTENHYFYWSDPRLHDPCIRVYDRKDLSIWVDIYWYIEKNALQVRTNPENVLIPDHYDYNSSLVCCSEGLREYTDHMCCGGCVAKNSVFPLRTAPVGVSDGISPTQLQPLPNDVAQYLTTQYGSASLMTREIKGWKGVACGFWISPLLFATHLVLVLLGTCISIVAWRKWRERKTKQRML